MRLVVCVWYFIQWYSGTSCTENSCTDALWCLSSLLGLCFCWL